MKEIAENLKAVRERIATAARKAGRNRADITLVAVSKMQGAEAVRSAYEAGHRVFGENYAQELEEKSRMLPGDIEWHFIGALQSNKVKKVLYVSSMIHSVDRLSLAKEIDKRAEESVRILIEVNIGGEATKSGSSEGETMMLLEQISSLPNIIVCGLMTMPPFFDDPDRARPYFAKLRELKNKLEKSTGLNLPHLSMGMTGDFEAAIEEGATIVRVGTAIFGARH